jgi:hypothetical protein
MTPTAELRIRDTRFADTGAALTAGEPTALAGLEVVWGRSTTVDQPAAATATAMIVDRSGGAGFGELVEIGDPLEVWAHGDISTGGPIETVTDGGFETMPLGAAGLRVSATYGTGPAPTATIVATPAAAGARALEVGFGTGAGVQIPPAAFNPSNPAAWDTIPRWHQNVPFTWSIAVRGNIGVQIEVEPVAFDGPADQVGSPAGPRQRFDGDLSWRTVSGTTTIGPFVDNAWLGVHLILGQIDTWTDRPGTWAEQTGTWADYTGRVWADQVSAIAPAGGLIRDVLVFAGRVTDLGATIDPDGTFRVGITAVDQLADLENVWIGAEPWPAETVAARCSRIIAAGGVPVTIRIDPGLDTLTISKRDVDNQPVGSLLGELAAGIDGVLWSAEHATTGAYLWLENMSSRAAVGTLELSGTVIVIVPAAGNRPAGVTVLDGCRIPLESVSFGRDVADLINGIDATWAEQTSPNVTEHTAHVGATGAGVRRMGVNTQLTTEAAAIEVGNRILVRTAEVRWRVEGLIYDLGFVEPAAGAETAAALDLLDGTTRLGRGLVVENVAYWPESALGLYLEGGRYKFDGAWSLDLTASPMGGMGVSAPWNTIDPTWRWNQFDPAIRWSDLYGVTA